MAEEIEPDDIWSFYGEDHWVISVEVAIDSEDEFEVGCDFVGKIISSR